MEIYGTLGPSCRTQEVIENMIREGMTGMRLNLSHTSLSESRPLIESLRGAERVTGKKQELLIDLQGPEMRIGQLFEEVEVFKNDVVVIPVGRNVFGALNPYQKVLIDDGKLRGTILTLDEKSHTMSVRMANDGLLKSEKSLKIEGKDTELPTLTEQDIDHLKQAKAYGVTAVMQPFVRSGDDLTELRRRMQELKLEDIRVFAKIENMQGVHHMGSILPLCDMVVIARGDLGNSMPLYELPAVQKTVEEVCKKHNKPYLVVTEMLTSMISKPFPTRAEVTDIFYAAYNGASAVMVTGETAIGKYPAEVIHYLSRTAESGLRTRAAGM